MYFCVPRSPDICLHCLMLLDFVHRIADIVAHLSVSTSTCRNHLLVFYLRGQRPVCFLYEYTYEKRRFRR